MTKKKGHYENDFENDPVLKDGLYLPIRFLTIVKRRAAAHTIRRM